MYIDNYRSSNGEVFITTTYGSPKSPPFFISIFKGTAQVSDGWPDMKARAPRVDRYLCLQVCSSFS